jgi:hypothetical protein
VRGPSPTLVLSPQALSTQRALPSAFAPPTRHSSPFDPQTNGTSSIALQFFIEYPFATESPFSRLSIPSILIIAPATPKKSLPLAPKPYDVRLNTYIDYLRISVNDTDASRSRHIALPTLSNQRTQYEAVSQARHLQEMPSQGPFPSQLPPANLQGMPEDRSH